MDIVIDGAHDCCCYTAFAIGFLTALGTWRHNEVLACDVSVLGAVLRDLSVAVESNGVMFDVELEMLGIFIRPD